MYTVIKEYREERKNTRRFIVVHPMLASPLLTILVHSLQSCESFHYDAWDNLSNPTPYNLSSPEQLQLCIL